MDNTIILVICSIIYMVIFEVFRRSTLTKIKNSDDADESCFYRKKFFWQRIISTSLYVVLALYIIFSGDEKGVNSIMAGVVYAWSSFIASRCLPLSGKRPNDILKSKFVLYLRGFAFDDYTTNSITMSEKNDINKFSEGLFIGILKQYMPVYAVGMTKELCSPIGADRIYLNDAEWESEVLDLMSRASLIVILLNDSQSCIWELSKSNQFKEKVVYICNNNSKLLRIRKELNKQSVYPIPIGLTDRTISYVLEDSNRVIISEYSNKENDYMRILKKIMYEKLGLRRFIFTQKRLKMAIWFYIAIMVVCWWSLALKFDLSANSATMWGLLSGTISFILILYAYDTLYWLLNKGKLK